MAMLYNLLPSASRRLIFSKQQQNIEKLQFYSKSKTQAQIQEAAESKSEETANWPQVK